MTDLTLRRCNICFLEFIPLEKVVFFECGHKACRSCAEDTVFRNNPFCAECRKPKGTAHRIYLTSDDLAEKSVVRIIEGLNKIDAYSPAASIEKASEKIRKFHKKLGCDSETSQALLSAAKGLEDRIAPMAVQLAQVEKDNSELLTRLRQLESKKRAYKERASHAESILKTEKEERHRLNERSQGYLSVIKQKDKKIADLQQELDEGDKKVGLMKIKLKSLSRSQRRPSRHALEDADASLRVEG